MLVRIVPLSLIVAIIACPLLCRNGQCQGCCAEEQALQSPCSAQETGDCCCAATSQEDSGHRPCDDDTGESGCQGVCGGAVLEKPSSLPAPTAMALLHDFDANLTPSVSRWADRHGPIVEPRSSSGMPPGRYIRTLHMSFLL